MRKSLPIFVALVCLCVVGCGSSKLKPQGRLLKQGAPLALAEDETIHITFFPEEDQPDRGSYPAKFNRDDSSFRVLGADGRGLPPGKYRACVQIMKKRKDTLDGAYGRTRSPFNFDITSEKEELTLDLSTPALAPAKTQSAATRRDAKRR